MLFLPRYVLASSSSYFFRLIFIYNFAIFLNTGVTVPLQAIHQWLIVLYRSVVVVANNQPVCHDDDDGGGGGCYPLTTPIVCSKNLNNGTI